MVTWIPHKKPPNLSRRFDPFTEMNDDELDDAMAAPVDREAAALQLSKLLKDWDNVIHGVAVGSIIDAVISMSFQCHFSCSIWIQLAGASGRADHHQEDVPF